VHMKLRLISRRAFGPRRLAQEVCFHMRVRDVLYLRFKPFLGSKQGPTKNAALRRRSPRPFHLYFVTSFALLAAAIAGASPRFMTVVSNQTLRATRSARV